MNQDTEIFLYAKTSLYPLEIIQKKKELTHIISQSLITTAVIIKIL